VWPLCDHNRGWGIIAEPMRLAWRAGDAGVIAMYASLK
jgi:hypothetical protein